MEHHVHKPGRSSGPVQGFPGIGANADLCFAVAWNQDSIFLAAHLDLRVDDGVRREEVPQVIKLCVW